MGYSNSQRAIGRVRQYLDQLVRASGEVAFTTDDPSKLAYHIREGIAVAKKLAAKNPVEPFASYSKLASKYIIRVDAGKVKAEPRDVLPITTLRQTMAQITLADLMHPLQIVGAAIQHKAPEMFFPDAVTHEEALLMIYNWGRMNGYFIVASTEGVTLTRNDPGEIAWKPQSFQNS